VLIVTCKSPAFVLIFSDVQWFEALLCSPFLRSYQANTIKLAVSAHFWYYSTPHAAFSVLQQPISGVAV
jgi:hypothetical protein